MKKAIVTGASGFVGGAVAKKLLLRGFKVYGVGRKLVKMSKLHEFGEFVPVIADYSRYSKLSELISEREFDVFFHFAWDVTDVNMKNYSQQLDNARNACVACEQAVALGAHKFILAGTCVELEILPFVNGVDTVIFPKYTYGAAKNAASVMCSVIANKDNIQFNTGLIAQVYGEGQYSSSLACNIIMRNLIKGETPALSDGDVLYDLVYVDDAAEAFIAISEHGVNGRRYYIGHRQISTFKDVYTSIGDIIAPSIGLTFGTMKNARNHEFYDLIDLDLLYRDTGWECSYDFTQSIINTSDFLKYNL